MLTRHQQWTCAPIDQTNVDVLLGWSDEYGIARLKSRCEDYLLTCNFEDPEKYMKIALTFRLPSLKQDTAKLIAHNLYKHRSCIAHCIGDPEAMQIILPPCGTCLELRSQVKKVLACHQQWTCAPIDHTNVDVLLGWADEYGIVRLKRRCEDYLLTCNSEGPENT